MTKWLVNFSKVNPYFIFAVGMTAYSIFFALTFIDLSDEQIIRFMTYPHFFLHTMCIFWAAGAYFTTVSSWMEAPLKIKLSFGIALLYIITMFVCLINTLVWQISGVRLIQAYVNDNVVGVFIVGTFAFQVIVAARITECHPQKKSAIHFLLNLSCLLALPLGVFYLYKYVHHHIENTEV